MAILSASELKTSREAIDAGVSTASDPDVERAISVAEARMNRALGYKVKNDATSIVVTSPDTDLLSLPERTRSITEITELFPGSAAVVVDATRYGLRNDGFSLYRDYPWFQGNEITVTGAFGYTESDDQYVLAREFVLLAAVRALAGTTSDDGVPTPAGGILTGYTTEGVSFNFYTPTGDTTGYEDLDRLLEQIGKHPYKKASGSLYTISMSRGGRDLGTEAIWLGLETPSS